MTNTSYDQYVTELLTTVSAQINLLAFTSRQATLHD